MGDVALRKLQFALEGAYASSAGSAYNGGAVLPATRALAPENGVGTDWKPAWYRPVDARGTYAGTYQTVMEAMEVTGKLPAAVYIDDIAYYGRMLYSGAPTITTLPATPSVLLAATAIAATMSLTTQPNAGTDGAQAKMLAVTLANTTASTAATNVTISGTDVYGLAITETLSFTNGTTTTSKVGGGAGALSVTLYTQHYFKTVNASGITTSVQTVGDTVAVGGVNAFYWLFQPDMRTNTLMSACAEYDDGTAGWSIPGLLLNKADLAWEFGKSFKFDAGMMAMKKVGLAPNTNSYNQTAVVGSRDALTNLAANNMAAMAAALGMFYADPIGTTPGTTQVSGRIVSAKFSVDNDLKLIKTGNGTLYPSTVGRSYYGEKVDSEFTLLFESVSGTTTDPAELAAFLAAASRTVRLATPRAPLPCGVLTAASGWPTALLQNGMGGSYGIYVDVAGKYETAGEKTVDGQMAITFKQKHEVDVANLGVGYQVGIVSRINPNMM